MRKRASAWVVTASLLVGGGCMSHAERPVCYSSALPTPPLKSVDAGGDFALFVDGAERAEIPVRVEEGQAVGFESTEDGRVQAVAGPFKMNLPPDTHEALWRRLNYKDE